LDQLLHTPASLAMYCICTTQARNNRKRQGDSSPMRSQCIATANSPARYARITLLLHTLRCASLVLSSLSAISAPPRRHHHHRHHHHHIIAVVSLLRTSGPWPKCPSAWLPQCPLSAACPSRKPASGRSGSPHPARIRICAKISRLLPPAALTVLGRTVLQRPPLSLRTSDHFFPHMPAVLLPATPSGRISSRVLRAESL
jgi:hypothetical protein